MRKLMIGLACAGLSGLCACTTARPIGLANGTKGQLIGCSGVQHSMNDCFIKAGEICPAGYDVVSGGEGYGSNSKFAALGGNNVGAIDRSLIVHCH